MGRKQKNAQKKSLQCCLIYSLNSRGRPSASKGPQGWPQGSKIRGKKKRTKRYPHSGAPGPTYQRHSQNAEKTQKSAGPAGPSGPPGPIITITITITYHGHTNPLNKCTKNTEQVYENTEQVYENTEK